MNKKKILLIGLIVIIICLFGCYYALSLKHNNNIDFDEESNADIDSDYLSNLLLKIPFYNQRAGVYKDAFYGEKVTIDDVSPLILDMFANRFRPVDEDLTKYKNEKIEEKYYDFNIDEYNKIKEDKKMDNLIVHLLANFNNYLLNCFNTQFYSIKSNDDITIYYLTEYNSKYIGFYKKKEVEATPLTYIFLKRKVEKNGDDIIIYEKSLFGKKVNNKYVVYKNSNISNDKNIFKELKEEELSKIKMKDYTTFKHTFKKNDFGHYWYSTEVVE